MKIYEILPGKLYQSRTTCGLSIADVQKSLLDYDITAIINLWHTRDRRAELCVNTYIHMPMPDGKYPDLKVYSNIAYKAVKLINTGSVVLTHCHAGVNRSGFLNAIIVMYLLGINGNIARAFIQSKRPKALNNEDFCIILDDLYIEGV